MKTLNHTLAAGILGGALLVGFQASGQEEELNAALAMKEKREEGLNKLAERIQNFGFLDYARKLVDRLDKRERKVDPFGMPMDPKQEGGAEVPMAMDDPIEDGPKTSLQEAVSRFRVTGVYPNRKEVVVGAQSLRVGDQILIKHGEVDFNLEISKVEKDSVELVDLETGEIAGVSLGIVQAIPQGMTRKRPPVQPKNSPSKSGTIVPMNRRQMTLDLSPKFEEEGDGKFGRE